MNYSILINKDSTAEEIHAVAVAFISKVVLQDKTQLTVSVCFEVDDTKDVVSMNVFNAETIDNLIMSVVDYYSVDAFECIAENDLFEAYIRITID